MKLERYLIILTGFFILMIYFGIIEVQNKFKNIYLNKIIIGIVLLLVFGLFISTTNNILRK